MSSVSVVIAVAILVGLAVLIISVYNRLVRKRNAVTNAWAQIDVQLRRRHELIPNLVDTVKGYAAHERKTLDAVVAARTAAMAVRGPQQRAEAENELTSSLRGLLAIAEAYPPLQASANFLQLQEELSDSEDRIAYSRQYYNDAALNYNNAIQTVPSNIVARATGFRSRDYFEAPHEERGPVRVSFE